MKIAHYGTASSFRCAAGIVVMHTLLHGLHGVAHNEIPVPLSLLQGLFVGVVVILTPIIAAGLLWTPFYRIGSWLLLGSMAGSLLSAIYNHHLVISPAKCFSSVLCRMGLAFRSSPLT